MAVQRTPKVFHSNYQAPRKIDWRPYLKLWPLALLLLLVVSSYLFFHLPIFNVKSVEIVGSADSTTISTIDSFKGRSIFAQSINGDVAHLRQNDLLLSSITCSRGIPDVIRCSTVLRQANLIWKNGNNYYAVDSNGYVFQQLTSPPPGLVIVEDRSGAPTTLGEAVATSSIIATYKQINSSLKTAGFITGDFYVTDVLYQVGVIVTGNTALKWQPANPINVLFITSSPVADQVETVVSVVQSKASQVTQSIDVRVPGYVYVK